MITKTCITASEVLDFHGMAKDVNALRFSENNKSDTDSITCRANYARLDTYLFNIWVQDTSFLVAWTMIGSLEWQYVSKITSDKTTYTTHS